MEEGSRSDQDVLSLSPHSEWHDTRSDCTDLDVADLMVIDEVGPDDSDAGAGTSPGALGHVEAHSSMTGMSQMSFSSQPCQEGESGETNESQSDGRVVVPSKNRLRKCPVCGIMSREKTRRHMMKTHLPWFWSGSTACWECSRQEVQASSLALRHTEEHRLGCFFDEEHLHLWCQLVTGCLHRIKSWFGCANLEDLLQYVIDRQLYEGVNSGFNDQEQQLLVYYAQNYSPDCLVHITANPPNHVISLTNWEIMASLLRRVGSAQQQSLMSPVEILTYEGSPILDIVPSLPEPFVFVDSHFHLDLVLKRLHFRTFLHMKSAISPKEHNNSFYYGIANYVFPDHWNDWALQVGPAQAVYVSFGIHPHVAAKGVTQKQLEELEFLLGNHKCVAVGEIGLDFTTRCDCKRCRTQQQCRQRMSECQEQAFMQMLEMAQRMKLPVILHCRDEGTGEAAARVLKLITENFPDLCYHRHCFAGNVEELRQWQSLPRVVFGITGKFIKDASNACNTDAISRILPHQLVLETDSPFLTQWSCCAVNHPWNLREVAVAVSERRNVPLTILNWTTNGNALKFYGIPKLRQDSASWGPRPC